MLDFNLIVNHQLFSDYYLGQILNRVTKKKNTQREKIWQSLVTLYNRNSFESEERLRARTDRFYDKIFAMIGFELQDSMEVELEDETFNVSHSLYAEGKLIGLVQYLPYDFSYDKKRRSGKKNFPSYINTLQETLEELGLSWGILTNGETIRLVKAGGGKAYLEFKIAEICRYDSPDVYESAFSIFYDLIQSEHFSSGYLDSVYEESKKHGTQVSDTLKDAILESVEIFARGVLSNPNNTELYDGEIEELYQESIIFMYRMLFVLYAEAHNLLPLADNPIYKENYSLDHLVNIIREPSFEADHRKATLWKSLKALFKVLEHGISHKSCAIAALNGELNSTDKHPFLDRIELSDEVTSEIIKRLTLTKVKGGGLDRISYRELDVAQLGSVYEGLLEYEPKIAEFNLTTKKIKNNEQLIRAEEDDKIIIREGEFYLSLWGGSRKGSGSYYTPKELTTFLVEKTLEPLVKKRTSTEMLKLKVIDTAMGSGAFLVAAINYLARAYGQKLIDEGIDEDGIMDDDEFMQYKRVVAEHCIYGVDLRPTAVELAKLSIWLTTFAKDRPLTFLDHRLRAGNSLVGAWLDKEVEFASPRAIKGKKLNSLYFVQKEALAPSKKLHSKEHQEILKAIQKDNQDNQIGAIINLQTNNLLEQDMDLGFIESLVRHRINELNEEECSAADVQIKAQLFEAERENGSEFEKLKTYLDLTCSVWFWDSVDVLPPDSKELYDIRKSLFGETVYFGISDERIDEVLHISHDIATKQLFFHWELEFPELYFDEDVKRLSKQGFDVVIGNPPWDVSEPKIDEFFSNFDPYFRSYSSKDKKKASSKIIASDLKLEKQWNLYQYKFEAYSNYVKSWFDREEILKGKIDQYRLFMLHNFHLLSNEGNLGQIIPSDFYTGEGNSKLRQLFFNSSQIDFLFSFENKGKRFFPIHASKKFVLFSTKKGNKTESFKAQFMIHNEADLYIETKHLNISKSLIEQFSPDHLSMSDFSNQKEIDITTKIYANHQQLGKILTELNTKIRTNEINMTMDSSLFIPISSVSKLDSESHQIMIEGKCFQQYNAFFEKPTHCLVTSISEDKLIENYDIPMNKSYRLAMRTVASATNQRTLIVNMNQNNTFYAHSANSIYLEENYKFMLLGLLNSFILDYAIRQKVSENVSKYLVNTLPIPEASKDDNFLTSILPRVLLLVSSNIEYQELWEAVASNINFKEFNTENAPLKYPSKVDFSQCTDKWNDGYIISGKTDTVNRFDIDDRAQLRAEIDAIVAHLYGLNTDEMSYIFDTFTALRNGEEREFGEFRSKRMVLEEMKRLEGCQNA